MAKEAVSSKQANRIEPSSNPNARRLASVPFVEVVSVESVDRCYNIEQWLNEDSRQGPWTPLAMLNDEPDSASAYSPDILEKLKVRVYLLLDSE